MLSVILSFSHCHPSPPLPPVVDVATPLLLSAFGPPASAKTSPQARRRRSACKRVRTMHTHRLILNTVCVVFVRYPEWGRAHAGLQRHQRHGPHHQARGTLDCSLVSVFLSPGGPFLQPRLRTCDSGAPCGLHLLRWHAARRGHHVAASMFVVTWWTSQPFKTALV